MELTHEQFIDHVNRLPAALRDAYFSDITNERVLSIGRRHSLALDQIGALANETGRLVVGLTPAPRFASVIQKSIGVDADTARDIAHDIDERILADIRAALHSFVGNGGGENSVAEAERGSGLGRDSGEPHPAREDVLKGIEEPETLPMKVREYPRAPSAAPIHATATPLETKPPTEAPAEKPAEIAPPHEHANLPAVEPDEHPMVVLAESHERAVPTPAPRPPVTPPITPASRASDPYREAIE